MRLKRQRESDLRPQIIADEHHQARHEHRRIEPDIPIPSISSAGLTVRYPQLHRDTFHY